MSLNLIMNDAPSMAVDHQPQPLQPSAKTNDPIDLVGGPFAVIESDPGVFTSLTRRLGIPGLELVELYDIEPWAVDHLNPHGLIFCFMWKKDAHRPTDFDDPAAERVWFANQLSDDACATHAILNVVLNCPGIELGEELSAFRRETEGMSPVMRGLAVTNSRVIRPAHNSLARPSDIRSSISNLAITTFDVEKRKEKELKVKARQDAKEKEKEKEKAGKPPPAKRAKTAAGTKASGAGVKGKGKEKATTAASKGKSKANPKPKAKRKRKSKYDDEDDEGDEEDEVPYEDEDDEGEGGSEEEGENEEETYHFIGYVPAHGKVWELDGLKSGPLEVGELPSPPSLPSGSTSSSSAAGANHPHPHPHQQHQGWMDIARPALRIKMDKYGGSGNDGSNIRFSLLAIVDDAFRKAQDEFEFWRRERAVLERALGVGAGGGATGGAGGEEAGEGEGGAGWEATVDPSLLASANVAFTPPVYPLPIPPVPTAPASNPYAPSTSDIPPPQPIPPTPSLAPTAPLKPFAKDFASRRMERDMQIMRIAQRRDIETNPMQELVGEWERCIKEGMKAKVGLEDELGKGVRANTDHIKRTFDYEPFIREYIARLRQEALLNPLLGRDEEGRKVRGSVTKGKGQAKGKGGEKKG